MKIKFGWFYRVCLTFALVFLLLVGSFAKTLTLFETALLLVLAFGLNAISAAIEEHKTEQPKP